MSERAPLEGDVALLVENDPAWTPHLASALSDAGAQVVVAGGSWGGAAMTLGGRYATEADVIQGISEVERGLARPRVLVNGPMRPVFATAGDTNDETASGLMRGAERIYRWNRVFGDRMTTSGGGVITNFAYGFAERGVAGASAFGMAQSAIVSATRSLAIEWAASRVRVCGVGLGWHETEPRPVEEQQQERLTRFLPLRRKGSPSDAVGLMVYMASPDAAFVSGQTVWVDGGAMAHA